MGSSMAGMGKDKRELAIELYKGLLEDIEREQVTSINATRRLKRIDALINDKKNIAYADCELYGIHSLLGLNLDHKL